MMRLYRTANGQWAGNEADAGKGFVAVNVDTTKGPLIALLNRQPGEGRAQAQAEASAASPAPPLPAPKLIEGKEADQLEEWLLDRATPGQVERLFAALGARFHELRKQARQ
jgi:hypothetical protein